MALRLLADHCVPSSIVVTLRSEGHEVLLLRSHLPTDAPDLQVIQTAQELNAILLTLDGDLRTS